MFELVRNKYFVPRRFSKLNKIFGPLSEQFENYIKQS